MEERKYFVYKHTFPNNKVYIGITQQQPEKRWKKGLGYDSHQKIMKRAIKKYGWNNIEHKILFANLTKEEACSKEIELIALYDSTNKQKGYNISKGGEGTIGVKPTMESKEKNRIAHLGKKASLETRRKISESNKGKHNKKISEEQKKKISETTKNAMKNPELRKKLSELAKKRKNNTKKVKCIETNKIYHTIREASKDTNIGAWGIGQNCLKKRKSAGGLHWEYI